MVRPTRTKPDGNQAEIVADLQAFPWVYYILDVHNLAGTVDIIVFGDKIVKSDIHDWIVYIVPCGVAVEIKNGDAPLTGKEPELMEQLDECGIVARSTEDVIRWFGQ